MWDKIKPYMPWNLLEFVFYVFFLTAVNNYMFDGRPTGYISMLASCALWISIANRRKMDKHDESL